MSLLEKLKSKTIEETVDSVKEAATKAAKDGLGDKIEGVGKLLPLFLALYMIFGDKKAKDKSKENDPPVTIINNYYGKDWIDDASKDS